ncbi:MAG: copper oxidase, partial [Betaproteobacteria bacterium]|nr:copper oxidase [Betaproteobacteria bacterium]
MREAENARKNRVEIVKARSLGQITRRDLIKMGMVTAGGLLIPIHGLSPFAKSAFAEVPTGTPRSPVPAPGDRPFVPPLLRLHNLTRHPLT